MKKVLCIFLSLILALSVATVAFAAGDDDEINLAQTIAGTVIDDNFVNAFNGKTLDFPASFKNDSKYYSNGVYDVAALINAGKMSEVEFLGLNLRHVYGTTDVLDWGLLNVSHAQMSLLWGEMNTYLATYMKPKYMKDTVLCTAANGQAIANFIGRLLYVNPQVQPISFSTDHVGRKDFCKAVSDASGLTDAIVNGWLQQKVSFTCPECKKSFTKNSEDVQGLTKLECPNCLVTSKVNQMSAKETYERKVNYLPLLLSALNVQIYNENGSGSANDVFEYFTTPSKEYQVPAELGGYIIKAVIENAYTQGPIAYLLSVIKRFVDGYTYDLLEPVYALLKDKVTKLNLSKEQMKDFSVLLNTLSNNNNPNDTAHMQYVPFPAYRYSSTRDTTEQFLYFMIYTNLLGKHKKNVKVVDAFEERVKLNANLSNDNKNMTNCMIDAMFKGDLTKLATNMQKIANYNLEKLPTSWGWNFAAFFSNMWKAIANFFDGIFRTLKNGINLNLIG